MHDTTRTANLLGATALAVNDLVLSGLTAAAGTSTSGAAALVCLRGEPGLSVTELGRRVGLSQPAAARMVDALEQRGLAERRPTVGRWVAVFPTDAGLEAVDSLLRWRGGRLTAIVEQLSTEDRTRLAEALDSVLRVLYTEVGDNERVCRLCDRAACTDNEGCPVGEAERASRACGGVAHAHHPDGDAGDAGHPDR